MSSRAKKLTQAPVAFRNCTWLVQSAEAVISTLDAFLEAPNDLDMPTADSLKKLRKSTVSAIRYRKRTFKSSLLRVYGLEKRAINGTQTYQAQLAQADSHAMKFIAFLTLVSLPVTGVATVFSSPFFSIDFDEDSTPLRVARCFWKFWVFVGPLTFGMCLLCFFWIQFQGFFSGVFSRLFSPVYEFLEWQLRTRHLARRERRRANEMFGV